MSIQMNPLLASDPEYNWVSLKRHGEQNTSTWAAAESQHVPQIPAWFKKNKRKKEKEKKEDHLWIIATTFSRHTPFLGWPMSCMIRQRKSDGWDKGKVTPLYH